MNNFFDGKVHKTSWQVRTKNISKCNFDDCANLTIVVDHAITIHICFFDHIFNFFFCQLLAQICHHSTQLCRRYQAIVVLIKDPVNWNLMIREGILLLMRTQKDFCKQMSGICPNALKEIWRDGLVSRKLWQTRTIGKLCLFRKENFKHAFKPRQWSWLKLMSQDQIKSDYRYFLWNRFPSAGFGCSDMAEMKINDI